MFRIPLLFSLFIFIIGGALLATSLLSFHPDDLLAYETLFKSSRPDEDPSLVSPTKQTRKNVTKEIWLKPQHVRIEGKNSDLFLAPRHATEKMQHVRCIIQEKLFFLLPDGRESQEEEKGAIPMQIVQYVEAEKAYYNYLTEQFVAENVSLWKYRLPGHTFTNVFIEGTELMQGEATLAEFTWEADELNFMAKELSLTFDRREKFL